MPSGFCSSNDRTTIETRVNGAYPGLLDLSKIGISLAARRDVSVGSRLASSVATGNRKDKEDGDEPRQGIRSRRVRRYPSRRPRMHRRAYYDNRARIRLRR